jgi:NosL
MRSHWISISVLIIVILFTGCAKTPDLQIHAGLDACHSCNMSIDKVNHAAGMIVADEFLTYDSPMCLLRHIESLPPSFVIRDTDIYLGNYNTSELVRADSVVMVLTTHVPTPMNGRVVCFSAETDAQSFSEYPDEIVTDWTGFQTLRGKPDVIVEASLTDRGFEPDVIEVNKGELLLLRVRPEGNVGDPTFSVRGYDEFDPVNLDTEAEYTDMRLLLTKPGAGFPIVDESGKSYGMIRVLGAHTDEEAEL